MANNFMQQKQLLDFRVKRRLFDDSDDISVSCNREDTNLLNVCDVDGEERVHNGECNYRQVPLTLKLALKCFSLRLFRRK